MASSVGFEPLSSVASLKRNWCKAYNSTHRFDSERFRMWISVLHILNLILCLNLALEEFTFTEEGGRKTIVLS